MGLSDELSHISADNVNVLCQRTLKRGATLVSYWESGTQNEYRVLTEEKVHAIVLGLTLLLVNP